MNIRVLFELGKLGFSYDDAVALGRIARTLRRWYELECGIEHGYIERDDETGVPCWTSAMTGKRTHRVPDREKGALKRLGKIMASYPEYRTYIQSDPLGASLYILPSTMTDEEAYRNHDSGLAVY